MAKKIHHGSGIFGRHGGPVMNEPIAEKISRWSLDRVRFLLGHIEGFIDDDTKALRQRAGEFSSQTGLDKIESLLISDPGHADLPIQVMDRLAPFFEAGMLIKRGPSSERENWWVTDLNWRGMTFHLELQDQIETKGLIPELTPLQVHKASASKILSLVNLPYLVKNPDADGYLLRPTPSVAYVFFTNLADHWAQTHLLEAQRLINKCFIY